MKQRRLGVCIAIPLLLALTILPTGVLGQPPGGFALPEDGLSVEFRADGTYVARLEGRERVLPQRRQLRLRFRTVDPTLDDPARGLPVELQLSAEARQAEQTYIVQFYTQAFAAYQRRIVELGGRIFTPLPDYSLLVQLSSEALAEVRRLPYVRWAGPYHPGYKLEEGLDAVIVSRASQPVRYSVLLFSGDDAVREEAVRLIEGVGGTVEMVSQSGRLEATLDGVQLGQVAEHRDVHFIDLWSPEEPDMNVVREISGASQIEIAGGYTGQGVRGEVMDTGMLTTHQDFQANPPIFHGGNSSSISHGTKVFSIVFGSRQNNPAAGGLLPDAEQPFFAASSAVGDLFAHVGELVDPSDSFRAVFQTRSIGNARTTEYTTISADFDRIAFEHDFLIHQSQSNAGNRDSRPQAWAKNILSVGGFRHFNTLSKSDDAWNNSASIGPAADGRIKPDLWHFFDGIRASNHTSNTGYTDFGGTSGATPIVAGHSGLVFQMWADGVFDGGPGKGRDVFDSRPHPTTVKALLVNSAFQYPFSGVNHDKTRVHQGWGLPDVNSLHSLAEGNGFRLPILIDETEVLAPLQIHTFTMSVSGSDDLKVTLVYADPPGSPGASVHRINDLTLRVVSPGGTVFFGNNGLLTGTTSTAGGGPNTVDTVENVFVSNPASGVWTIEVRGDEIVQDSHLETAALDADYALVATGGSGGAPPPPPPSCSDCIDWSTTTTVSYSNQDVSANVSVEDGGSGLLLRDNTWRRTSQTFNVDANTVLEFEFSSSSQGEILAIGFDENDTLNDAPRLFNFWGTQNWTGGGRIEFTPRYSGSGSFESFSIPVGQFYTGSNLFLVLANDNDAGSGNDGHFRNVRILSGAPPPGACSVEEDFEAGIGGWLNSAASSCSTGTFVAATPTEVSNGGVVTQVGGDHTTGSGNALFTATNSSAGNADVDGGNCIVESPVFGVSEASELSIWYFHGQRDAGDDPTGDFFRLEVSTDGGSSYSSLVSFGDVSRDAVWTQASRAIAAGSQVRIRVQVSDGTGAGDLIEGGVDDLTICSSN